MGRAMRFVARCASLALIGAAVWGGQAAVGAAAPAGTGAPLGPAAVRAFGPLAELPAGHWVYRSLEELIRAGLVVEYGPGAFDGERTITRYEAALLLVDAYRRAGAVGPDAAGTVRLRTLLTERLVESAQGAAGGPERLREVLRKLGQELAEELQVLGFAPEGVEVARTAAVAVGGVLELRSPVPAAWPLRGDSATTSASSSGDTSGMSAPGESRAEPGPEQVATQASASPAPEGDALVPPSEGSGGRAGLGAVPPPLRAGPASYELGLRFAVAGRADVDGQVDLGTLNPTRLGLLLVGPGQDRWVWARVGRVDSPPGSALAVGEAETLTLQGIEARLLGAESRTGVVIATPDPPADVTSLPAAPRRVIAVLDGSLALSRQIVVGGALVRGSADPLDLWKLDRGTTVTALSGRYSPAPWLSITGEYAQNLWSALPSGPALRLGASLNLGDVRLGARVGRVAPDFQPALGPASAGDEVGVDATVRLGDVQVRAGTEQRRVDDGTGRTAPERTTSLGLRVGLMPGASVSADYELVSVEDLEQGSERSRTRVGLDWEATAARVQLGVEWKGSGGAGEPADGGVEATAALSYQLSPYAAVMLGYHLIDFGDDERAGATARLTLRF